MIDPRSLQFEMLDMALWARIIVSPKTLQLGALFEIYSFCDSLLLIQLETWRKKLPPPIKDLSEEPKGPSRLLCEVLWPAGILQIRENKIV